MALLVGMVLFSAAFTGSARPPGQGYHSTLGRMLHRTGVLALPVLYSDLFATSGRCAGCHGHDVQGFASVDQYGRDVNVADDWRSGMMANSARDPFFRAKASHELLVNPGHAGVLDNKCLSCHAPLAMHEEHLMGRPAFTLAMLDTSVLGLDGVSCLSCHGQSPDSSGLLFSGQLKFDIGRVYGPYPDDQILADIMTFFVGFEPGFGPHVNNSSFCAGCHTLITETVDLEGEYTGGIFVEQATYHEWKNSVYNANGTHCQDCHMPRLFEPIVIASDYAFLEGQEPFGLHHLVGGNVFMLELLKRYRDTLAIPATDVQFDSTIARSKVMLERYTLSTELDLEERTADTAFFSLKLTNLTGHKFPSGYPSRRAFVEFSVIAGESDTLFKSGILRADGEVEGHDPDYERHHQVIRHQGQVQIYEMVMGDVLGNPTTVLERAATPLKDNRLPPIGFTSSHYTWDTVKVAGLALLDPDFNKDVLGQEGTGADIIRYHVPMNGYTAPFRATARVFFQPVPPGWNAEMFAYSSPEIDAFRDMYHSMDVKPSLVGSDSLFSGTLGTRDALRDPLRVYPNPTADGAVRIVGGGVVEVPAVYDAQGRLVAVRRERVAQGWRIVLPQTRGTYYLRITGPDGERLERVVRE